MKRNLIIRQASPNQRIEHYSAKRAEVHARRCAGEKNGCEDEIRRKGVGSRY